MRPNTPYLLSIFETADRVDSFLRDHFPDRSFLSHGPLERLGVLQHLTLQELIGLPNVYTRAYFTVDGKLEWTTPAPEQILDLYEAGFTIYFHAVSSPALNAWRDGIGAELGLVRGVARLSAFASRKSAGLHAHFDRNDNIVIQLRGTKRWRLAPNEHVSHPMAGWTLGDPITPVHRHDAPRGFPSKMPDEHRVVDCTPGTVMFVPRGVWHDTATTESESLHVNLQTGLPMWKDLASYLMRETPLLCNASFREPILDAFEGGRLRPEVRAELRKKLVDLIARLDEENCEVHEPAFSRLIMGDRGSFD
jgi:50S ribosomal protein L16 3-hydroxylase